MTSSSHRSDHVEMPRRTVWPLVLSLGVSLLLVGVITHWLLFLVGLILMLFGVGGWIGQLMPGVGHVHEPLAPLEQRPQPIRPRAEPVEQLKPDHPGYRFRIPEKIHPISSGVKGGIVGGLVMPLPAVTYGLLVYGSVWWPINLLAGIAIPGVETMTREELQQFSPLLFVVALFIHGIMATGIGAMYGVILPTIPQFPGAQLLFGGLIMPLLWSGICFGLMGAINPALEENVDWRFFIMSQMFYGIAASLVIERSGKVYVEPAGGGT